MRWGRARREANAKMKNKNYLKLFCAVAALSLSSCNFSLDLQSEDRQHFVIRDLPEIEAPKVQHRNAVIIVREPNASRLVNGTKIIFSKTPASRGSYQYAYWVDPPSKRLGWLLIERLERAKLFRAAAGQASAVSADYQLNTDFIDLYHDVRSTPGSVHAELVAEIVDLDDRTIVARKEFVKDVRVDNYSVDGAVEGTTRAMNEMTDEIIRWMDEKLPK